MGLMARSQPGAVLGQSGAFGTFTDVGLPGGVQVPGTCDSAKS